MLSSKVECDRRSLMTLFDVVDQMGSVLGLLILFVYKTRTKYVLFID